MAKALAQHKIITCLHKFYPVELLQPLFQTAAADFAAVSCGIKEEDINYLAKVHAAIPDFRFICLDVANGYTQRFASVVAAPFIAYVFIAFGWKWTFVGIGLLGLLWIIPWLIINKNTPDKHPWITKEEQDYIASSATNKATAPVATTVYTWKQLLQFKNTWGIISSRFFIDPVWWMFVTWLPQF